MKITGMSSWDADMGNTRPYTIAFKTVEQVRNVFVEITLENGITGLGAGNPSEYVTGESYESCLEAIREANGSFPVGRDIREIRQLTDELRSEEHTSELQSRENLVCRLLLEKKNWSIRMDVR